MLREHLARSMSSRLRCHLYTLPKAFCSRFRSSSMKTENQFDYLVAELTELETLGVFKSPA